MQSGGRAGLRCICVGGTWTSSEELMMQPARVCYDDFSNTELLLPVEGCVFGQRSGI